MSNNHSSKNSIYADAIRETAIDFRDEKFSERAERLIADCPILYADTQRAERFSEAVNNHDSDAYSNKFIAALYLLTANKFLWNRAKFRISGGEIKFGKIAVDGIGIDGCNYFRAASDILYGTKYLMPCEIVSAELVSDSAFTVILNGLAIAKFGVEILENQQRW